MWARIDTVPHLPLSGPLCGRRRQPGSRYQQQSDDERHVLADTSGESNPDLQGVWRIDLERGTQHRLLRGGIGLWSPDGQQVAFATGEGGISDLFLTSASGQDERQELLRTPEPKG